MSSSLFSFNVFGYNIFDIIIIIIGLILTFFLLYLLKNWRNKKEKDDKKFLSEWDKIKKYGKSINEKTRNKNK